MNLSHLYDQISDAEQRIADLQAELEGLDAFRAQLGMDLNEVRDQTERKAAVAGRAAGLSNVRIAQAYQERLASSLGLAFQENVFSCFDAADGQAIAAMGQVEEEIREQRRRVWLLEERIEEEKARERERLRRQEELRFEVRRQEALRREGW